MEATRELANLIIETEFENLPEKTIDQAKICLLDHIGCALAGSQEEAARIIVDTVLEFDKGGDCTILGSSDRSSSFGAALANGSMAHVLELDDGHRRAMGHPGSASIPSALAAAELFGCGGAQFVTAVVLGYETFFRIGAAVNPSHHKRGFHTTGTVGTFAAAAAAGKIMGLDKEEMASALGLAGTQASGLWEFLTKGTMNKCMHAGKAAQNGLLSALLAKKGFTGPDTILEGDRGFCKAMSDSCSLDGIKYESLTGIMGVYFKLHASCRYVHTAIDAVLNIVRESPLNPDEIDRIDVRTFSLAADLDSKTPDTVLGAKMSLPYSVAVALLERRASPDEFSIEKIRDPRVRELSKKIVVVVDPEFDKLVPDCRPATVEIKKKSGSVLRSHLDLPVGEPELPASRETIINKFMDLSKTLVSQERAKEIAVLVDRIDRLSDMRELTRLLATE